MCRLLFLGVTKKPLANICKNGTFFPFSKILGTTKRGPQNLKLLELFFVVYIQRILGIVLRSPAYLPIFYDVS